MTLWLNSLGANVAGLALEPPFQPNLFSLARLNERVDSRILDLSDREGVRQAVEAFQPEIVFHLAAQSLVLESYRDPVGTYQTNVMGTLNLLEAVRAVGSVRALVNVTTDKCYENAEWDWPYREIDPLGGHDMYSSSKAASEILTSSYRRSFFPLTSYGTQHTTLVATARAGNVIGGGDWSANRVLPDCFRALATGHAIAIRNPNAVRPWQHVLEPIRGYMALAKTLFDGDVTKASAFNFGPNTNEARPVSWILSQVQSRFADLVVAYDSTSRPHEAKLLRLDCSKALVELGWSPRWTTEQALAKTCDWFEAFMGNSDMGAYSVRQIEDYTNAR